MTPRSRASESRIVSPRAPTATQTVDEQERSARAAADVIHRCAPDALTVLLAAGGIDSECLKIPSSSELPQRSVILPSSNRAICMPRASIFFPVGATPRKSPLCVPVIV